MASNKENMWKKQLIDELKNKQAITDALIHRILYSKRLLVDHVEALEQCMLYLKQSTSTKSRDENDSGDHPSSKIVARKSKFQSLKKFLWKNDEIFTARNTCVLVGSTVIEQLLTAPSSCKLIIGVPAIIISGSFSALYVVKKFFSFRNKIVETSLDSLIQTIDDFGNCIRRNMTYFNEIIIMKQHELIESRQIERAWDCITAAKEVTEILYDATRKLEADYPLPLRFIQYYSPMEELRECEYFKNNVTDYAPKQIKDFHNIYVYVQSQFLLRLALTIATKPSISEMNTAFINVECLVRQLVQEEENHFKNLTIEQNRKKQLELEELNNEKAMQNRSGPVAVLQDSSLKLSSRMVAVAGECQALDITLQRLSETEAARKDNAKHLVEVSNNMRSIENALGVCFDDFQRLILVYNKFLSNKLIDIDERCEKKDMEKASPDSNEYPESFLRVEISKDSSDDKKDDFYAYIFDEEKAKAEEEQLINDETERFNRDLEILNFEKRVTKGRFRPVLKQLKDRIDPIRKDMLEKERRVLTSKGINVDELFKSTKEHNNDDSDDDDGAHYPKSDKFNRSVKFGSSKDNRDLDESDFDNGNESDTESEGSADLEFQRRKKILKEQDNFSELRKFLAQKPPLNLYDLTPPNLEQSNLPTPALKEDILESEC